MAYKIHGDSRMCLVISNKLPLSPRPPKPEPQYTLAGWYGGYEFRQFLGNCYAWLGDWAALDGMQQLCHQYYLQNGSINAQNTAIRIKKFLKLNESGDGR